MTPSRTRPPFVADERTQLLGWLEVQRGIVVWKCEGLSDVDARRSVIPSSPLMTMAGLVSHLRWTEHCWFEALFLGQGMDTNPQFVGEDDDDWRTGDAPIAQLVDEYVAQCARADEIIAAHDLDDVGSVTDIASGTATLRWMLIHMVEETARHAGHADLVRELLDGTTGYY